MEPRKFTSHARFVHGILCVLGERQERPQKAVSAERFGMEEKMKEKWNELKVTLTETTEMSKREFVLSLMVCLLGGIVFGSHNGNNCGNTRLNEEDEGEIADWDEIEKQEL